MSVEMHVLLGAQLRECPGGAHEPTSEGGWGDMLEQLVRRLLAKRPPARCGSV